METTNNEEIKQTKGKPPIHYTIWKPIRWLIRIRLYGEKKYPKDTWREVKEVDYFDSCMRHLIKWEEGERTDKESGLPHLAHALCNLVYLIEITEKEPTFDE